MRIRFYDRVAEAEKLARKRQPSPADAKRVCELLREPQVAYHFFDAVCEPLNLSWLGVLADAGYFDSFPEPVEGKFWQWPAGKYVKLCASAEPDLVAKMIRHVQTENMSVYTALAEAAAELPGDRMADVAPVVASWLGKPAFRLVDALASLMAKLAQAERAAEALDILRRFLKVGEVSTVEDWVISVELAVPLHDVADILSKHLMALVSADAAGTLAVLESSLLQVLRSKRWKRDERQDYSSVWRDDIGQGDSRAPHDPNDLLVNAMRDVLLSAGADQPDAMRGDLSRYLIGERLPYILTRLAMYTLTRCPETYWDLVMVTYERRGYMAERSLNPELIELVRSTFDKLRRREPELAAAVLRRVDRMGRVSRQRLDRALKREISEDSVRTYVQRLQRDWLAVLREHLDGPRLRKLKALTAHLDKADAEAASERELGMAQVRQSRGLDLPSALSHEDIRRNPQTYVDRTGEYAPGVAAAVDIQAILSGLRFAVQDGNEFKWDGVIPYCESVIRAPADAIRISWDHGMEAPAGWHVVAVADLLAIGLARESLEPDPQVLDLLLMMLDWLGPPGAHENSQPATTEEPWYASFHDPRSMTLTALIRYAHQIGWRDPERPENEWPTWQKLDEKVRVALEEHLRPGAVLSATARSVFGRFLPHLTWLDCEWATSNLGLILPPEKERSGDWWAVWSSYLFFNQFYPPLLPLLRADYERGISRATQPRPDYAEKSDQGLATHVMNAMFLDLEPYSDARSLTATFLRETSGALRGEAVGIVGRWVNERGFTDFGKVWTLLKGFWRSRVDAAVREPASVDSEELAAFSVWLRGLGEPPSVLDDLIRPIIPAIVEHRRHADLIDYLAHHPDDQAVAVELLNEVLQTVELGWMVYPEKSIRKVLEGAHRSKIERALSLVDDAVNRLGELGSKDFRDLLP